MNLAKTRKLDQIPQDFPTNHQKSGQVFVVGSGDCGQLGLGPEIFESHRPKLLSYFDDKDIIRVFAGGLHNIVLSGDGKVF
jgi:regulator of chromosome condensation